MWSKIDKIEEEEIILEAIEFIGDHILYGNAMSEVIFSWKYSMKNFLTNPYINKKAYLGHCAVFYKKQIPEYLVRIAWKKLSNKQRELANIEALKNIKKWELIHKKELENILINGRKDVIKKGYQMKLHFH